MTQSNMMSVAVSVALLLAASATAIGQDSIGKVIAISGSATATGQDGQIRQLALKSDVFLNDKISTAAGSKIQIMLNDDSVLSQGESSEMLIDKYVYDPDQKKKDVNCSVKMVKGVFRAATGKIAEINPDRFKVRTKMATIGIRGCEIGFALRPDREDVYVLELPRGKKVLIKKLILDELIESDIESAERILTVAQEGVAVTIQSGLELKERQITPEESKQLIGGRMPASAGGGSGGGTGGKDQGGRELLAMHDKANDAANARAQSDSKDSLANQANSWQPGGSAGGTSEPEIPTIPVLPPPTEGPSVAGPTTEPVAVVGGSPMGDWEWGLWNDGTTQYSENRYNGSSFLTASEFSSIALGSQTYNLSGSGSAGAVLYEAASGNKKTITGTVNMQVQVGGGASSAWGGSFALGDQTDGLNFSVSPGSGAIASDGALSLGTLSSYSMTINGASYGQGSLTAQSLSGRLIKPSSGVTISAAAGEFSFQHGNAARANGVFGSDLQ